MKAFFNHKSLYIIILSLFFINKTQAQNEIIQLWNKIPDAINATDYKEKETIKEGVIQNSSFVSVPTLSIFVPKDVKPNQTAIIIFPGGGYSHLSMDKEGTKVANWLNSLGITAFVLKYRLPSDLIMKNKSIGPLQDAQKAMRYVRKNASKWNIDSTKIGTIGFSAGGHLASTLATHYDEKTYEDNSKTSARPDFSILIYPVISMESGITHKGSQTSLLGNNPSQSLIDSFSNEKKVTPQTPPTFLVHATDDAAVVPENSINYYLALKKNAVTSELHLYENGGHGFGLGVKETSKNWTKDCEEWLKSHGY